MFSRFASGAAVPPAVDRHDSASGVVIRRRDMNQSWPVILDHKFHRINL
jgi:hypothetical protein